MPCASSGCAGLACDRSPGGWGANSSPAPSSPRCATPSGCASCAATRKRPIKALLEALPGWSVRARLGSLWQPVAIISTSHDYLPLAKRVEQFASLPNASIHTPEGHHAWPAEDPAGFNHLLQRILATH
jgi:hypothetical protein